MQARSFRRGLQLLGNIPITPLQTKSLLSWSGLPLRQPFLLFLLAESFTILFRMWWLLLNIALILAFSCRSSGQWHMQDSHTNADLRGIHSIGNGIVWASGTNGTILRTTDDGDHWQPCATPSGAEVLDFRGIQGFDANTAIVMSSGKGDLSRLYKTTDACHTWKLVFTNPDKDGFWDALRFSKPWPTGRSETNGVLIGDPVAGTFSVFLTSDRGETWRRWGRGGFGWKDITN